ncbi:MAG TPA: hypothetical protein VF039_11090 [Longimicrobiales bacterium]
MWPVVSCAVVAASVVAWRLLVLSVELGRARALIVRTDDLVGRGMLAEALAAAREAPDAAGHVLVAGLSRRAAGTTRVVHAFRSAQLVEHARLERGLAPLAAIATVAPLVGALSGVLRTLADSATWNAVALAPLGVGVAVGIAASVFNLWLANRIERFAADMRRSTEGCARAIAELDGAR